MSQPGESVLQKEEEQPQDITDMMQSIKIVITTQEALKERVANVSNL